MTTSTSESGAELSKGEAQAESRLWEPVRALFDYLWSGWGSLTGVFLLLALWQAGHEAFGSLVLPDPAEAISVALGYLSETEGLGQIGITARRAFIGFLLASLGGVSLGMLAGVSVTLVVLSRPFVTVMLGVPPIAWIVLALLWFGGTDGAPIFTVFITTFPIVFAAALQGMHMRDGALEEMATSFRSNRCYRLIHVRAPQVVSYVFPAWVTALGLSWKVVVMAELLASADGIGAGLSSARVNIDTAATMAWIIVVVSILLITEYFFIDPLKRRVEAWKSAG